MSTNSLPANLTIAECLESFEDTLFASKRTQGFQHLKLLLQDNKNVTAQETLRILAVFEKCLELDTQSIPYALGAILTLLTNAKSISNIHPRELLPSALAVLYMLKSVCALETQHLTAMGVEVFLSHPVDTLSMIIRHECSEVLEIFEHFTSLIIQGENKMMHVFLNGLLNILPPQEKKQLIQEGLPKWFKIISVIMDVCAKAVNDVDQENIECLEVVTEALAHVDYFQCPQWQHEILRHICTRKYSKIITKLLNRNYNEWHRIWAVFTNLLKTHITRSSPYGTPIQPMLEIVEAAFKMDGPNRCRAFQCWDILIDNLSADTNEKNIPRYLKLLLIPLKLNNTRTEDTTQTKLHTWWKFIIKFQTKLDQSTNDVLHDFLRFMFGKKSFDKKQFCYILPGAGQTYESVKSMCLQALAEIVGHNANCNCCTDLPKLNEKMFSSKLLASHWDEWMYALKTAILMTNNLYELGNDTIVNKRMEVFCIWKAFVNCIAELPPNGDEKDMFNELIQVLKDLLQSCNNADNLPDILFTLTLSLIENNEGIRKLLALRDDQPLAKIMSVLANPRMNIVFVKFETQKMVEILKPLTDFAVESSSVESCIGPLLNNRNSLKVWVALAQSMNEAQTLTNMKTLKKMLTFPVLSMREIEVDKYTATTWQILYDNFTKTSNIADFDQNVLKLKCAADKNVYFKTIVANCILKKNVLYPNEEHTKILETITAEVELHYKQYEEMIPLLLDTWIMILNVLVSSSDENLANVTFKCVTKLMQMFFADIKSQDSKDGNAADVTANIFVMLDNIFKALQPFNKTLAYSHIFNSFLVTVSEFAMSLDKESILFKFILSKMNYLTLNNPIGKVKTKIVECIKLLTENSDKTVNDTRNTVKVFTSPNVKKVVKRSKKKEPVIVNTVTENGEEYEVVKSNWKFNPKKLTENQKEKLRRKREDIPALYQDLSQSQDEFKLLKWKTDSQDTTTSSNSISSKLTTNDDASNILKNIPNSDVVPNIMQNILSESDKNHAIVSNKTNTTPDLKTNESAGASPSTPRNTKSPRMALKDRVFRNVRNLIEKSSPKNDTTDAIGSGCKLKRTPSAKTINNANIINSAPPLMSADRPSRVKRIPKKFADVKLFGLKKRRYSQTNSDSENEIELLDDFDQNSTVKNIVKAKLDKDNSNAVDDQPGMESCDVTEVKESESVTDAQESIVRESGHESANEIFYVVITDNLHDIEKNENISNIQKKCNDPDSDNNNKHDQYQNKASKNNGNSQDLQSDNVEFIPEEDQNILENNSSQDCQKNDDAQMGVVAQDNEKNELLDKGSVEDIVEPSSETDGKNNEIVALKTPVQKTKQTCPKSAVKKSTTKKSRIEKELAIDMVEGHPYLQIQSEKRLTRKKLIEPEKISRRRSVPLKSNKTKAQTRNKKSKDKELIPNTHEYSETVEETQEKYTLPDDAPYSEDVIESSQDSNFTTISVKSTKWTSKLKALSIERLEVSDLEVTKTEDLLQDSDGEMLCVKSINQETKDDIELPQNKTAEVDKNQSELTENMDTEPVIDEKIIDDVIIIEESPITISSKKNVELDTEELADADTQPFNSADFEFESNETSAKHQQRNTPMDITERMSPSQLALITEPESPDAIEISSEPKCSKKNTDICSPFKGFDQRKQDFLDNTSEISPIKIQSPEEKTSPEKNEETSSDYLVVKLSSPVHSNGEPFTSKGSPEFFTEDKTSPDKRDQSPPRAEVVVNSGSPSSSLSLKKNRLQTMRPGGRAAHMVGLCVPDSLNSKKSTESEEPKKLNTSTPARRNLRVLYNAVSDNSDISDDKEPEPDNFLKLNKALPSIDSSPVVPILKRKIDTVDDTASPASKSKRVSFHDPPVSTTVSVQKYIKSDCIESPSVAQKRIDINMTRSLTKSPKKSENIFKLDTILSRAVESFGPEVFSLTNDTNTSLDVTPAVEVVNTSELNDTDPICPDLVDCKDPLKNIAPELTSMSMQHLFLNAINGELVTVGDLAKLTELDVNRLRIKAPKIQVAKKALAGYASKRVATAEDVLPEVIIIDDETVIAKEMNEDMTEPEAVNTTIETQTDKVSVCETASQTRTEVEKSASTQTTSVSTVDINTQTLESGYKPTSEIITSLISEREDCLTKLGELLPTNTIIDFLANKSDDSKLVLTSLLDRQSQELSNEERKTKELSVLKDVLLERFDHKDLILFCSRLFQGLYDKSA